jgi:glycosyltransferase involved in cell wall biosynthesis
MRIVYNTDQIYKHGGIEKVMATKVNYLVNQTHFEVYIVTTEQQNKKPCYLLDSKVKLMDLGVNYNRNQSYLSLGNLSRAIPHFFRQKKLYKQLQPDVLISPNYNFDHFWLPFILPKKTKLVKELHSSRYQEPNQRKKKGIFNKWYWKLQDWIESKYQKVVVLNKDEALYRPGSNVVVLPNPVEPNAHKANLNAKKVIAAGRIAPVKGYDHLIKAWKVVNELYPEWELHIYGDAYGSTGEELQQLIDNLDLNKVVQLLPSVEDLPQIMLNYSIFALSSVTECFPTVILEALAVGLPVVSYDCPNGPRNIIRDKEDGLLVNERKIELLANSLIELIQNDELRKQMGKKAKENCKKFYTNSIMADWVHFLKKRII